MRLAAPSAPARPARRQTGQHGRVDRLHRPAAGHPGVQPVWHGAPPHRRHDGAWDVLLVDLQDLGCRIYTSSPRCATCSEAPPPTARRCGCWTAQPGRAAGGRPQPARRLGKLRRCRPLPMRHGLTLGELGHWFIDRLKLDVEYRVIPMTGWQPTAPRPRLADGAPGSTQPQRAQPVDGARLCRHGDAGRHDAVRKGAAPRARWSCSARPTSTPRGCWPTCGFSRPTGWPAAPCAPAGSSHTFHKHAGQLCAGVQIHTEDATHYDHAAFRPGGCRRWPSRRCGCRRARLPAVARFSHEYETRLAIDIIGGGPLLREWVDDAAATPAELDALARAPTGRPGSRRASPSWFMNEMGSSGE